MGRVKRTMKLRSDRSGKHENAQAARRSSDTGRAERNGRVSHITSRAEINAANNVELRTNAQQILSVIHSSRPKNTISAYVPKQEEFQDFY